MPLKFNKKQCKEDLILKVKSPSIKKFIKSKYWNYTEEQLEQATRDEYCAAEKYYCCNSTTCSTKGL